MDLVVLAPVSTPVAPAFSPPSVGTSIGHPRKWVIPTHPHFSLCHNPWKGCAGSPHLLWSVPAGLGPLG